MQSDTPKSLVTAPLAARPDGAHHIVAGDPATPKEQRAACAVRGELSSLRYPIAPESLSHPDNDDFDPTTSPLCSKCLDVHRLAADEPEPVATSGEPETLDDKRLALQQAVHFAYDLQKLRIQQGNRAGPQADASPAKLDEKQARFLGYAGGKLELLEQDAFKETKRLLAQHPIYDHWLSKQKGCGPTMSAVIIAFIDIRKVEMCSQLWAWCGLAVRSGPCTVCKGKGVLISVSNGAPGPCYACDGTSTVMEADRRRKGEKTRYNPWLKSKIIAVLGSSFIKANSPWRSHYDGYKNRKKNQIVDRCMLCHGTGKYVSKPKPGAVDVDEAGIKLRADGVCSNCEGKGGGCAWGKSDAHRHAAAVRYMVKMFLQQLYVEWRTLEGLSVRAPYQEQYLGHKHHETSRE